VEWYRKLVTFLQEVVAELKRATWPSWNEVRGTTIVVIMTLFVFALYLFVVDLALGYLYQQTVRIFG